MRILSIGNSFSQDAQRYFHGVAKSMTLDAETANLYIGGCSLERHCKNMLSGINDYSWEYNGYNTQLRVTLDDALLYAGHWDIITLQQASHESTVYENYTPYLQELASYVRRCAPKAKILIHQTWSYEEGSERLTQMMKYHSSEDMLRDVKECYAKAAKEISADGIIPSGEMMYNLHKNGIEKVHRDTFHATLGAGRYALALLWIRMIYGVNVTGNDFSDFDENVSDEEKKIIWKTVDLFDPINFNNTKG